MEKFSEVRVVRKLFEHMSFAQSLIQEPQFFGLFLCGSQHYGMATDKSDVDTKLVYFPTRRDFATGKGYNIKQYSLPNGEHLTMIDFLSWIKQLKKSSPNTLECLFGKYRLISARYGNIWQCLVENSGRIATADPNTVLKAWCGLGAKYCEGIDKNADPFKYFANLKRVRWFADAYVSGADYQDCIRPTDSAAEHLLDIRNGKSYTIEDIHQMKDEVLSQIKAIVNSVPEFEPNEETMEMLDSVAEWGMDSYVSTWRED